MRNIQRRPWRSFCLILSILLFSFFLFVGSVLSLSLSNGAESAANRLGADVMIVPSGYDSNFDSILLSGNPSSFYLPGNVMERLNGFEGIARMSPQIFLATLDASCCSFPVQLVGIDYDTDFIVKAWLKSALPLQRDLADGEVILGAFVEGRPGDILFFFGRELRVAGRLEQTGMGFDSTVFMTRPTALLLMKEAENTLKRPLSEDGSLVSTVMLKLKPGYDSMMVAREINRSLNSKGIYALFSKKFVNSISDSLSVISWMVRGGLFLLWALAVAVVALIFSMTLAERRREMGILRALGASRGKLVRLCLTEAFLISLYGALLGVILGGVTVAVGSPLAVELLHLPFLLPSLSGLALLAAAAVGVALLTGIIAVSWSAAHAGRLDAYDAMREA